MSKIKRPLIIALLTFLVASVIDERMDLEAKVGLAALFQFRGARMPPDNIVIVALDEKSDDSQSGGDFTLWRGKHAQLIRQLKRQGAAFIVFDLFFNTAQPGNDPELAEAMRSAGNVLAVDCLQTSVNSWIECGTHAGPIEAPGVPDGRADALKINPPTPELASAMLDHSPFFLGNDPDNPTLRQGWNFIDDYLGQPALPTVLWFYVLKQQGGLMGVADIAKPLSVWLSGQRRLCTQISADAAESLALSAAMTQRVMAVICQNEVRNIDFYGSPASFPMLSYNDVLSGKVSNFRDKIVFVGQISRKQADSFLTPFTDSRSGRMVGVEVMATQFANLMEGRELAPPLSAGVVMAVFAWVACLLLVALPGLAGIVASILYASVYLMLAIWFFKLYGAWLPIAVPVLLQLPAAILLSTYWSRADQLREAKNLEAIVARVTLENNRLINQFIEKFPRDDPPSPSKSDAISSKTQRGVCLVSDIEGFTGLAEKMPPEILLDRLREYFKLLGGIISAHGGRIANVTGDGMVAIWADRSISSPQLSACTAAIEITRALERFNSLFEKDYFLTRFGVHEGEFAVIKQAGDQLDGNPIGDAVNTAARLEAANKLLGTRILVSASISAHSAGVMMRPVGTFLLSGKSRPIRVVEVVDFAEKADKTRAKLNKQFASGLKAFQKGEWKQASVIFNKVRTCYGFDGPTRYYLEKIAGHEKPPVGWNGAVKLETKPI